MFTFKEFFKKYEPEGTERLSRARRNNIRSAVFERISETENTASKRSFRFKPALIAAAAAAVVVTGVTVGAFASQPEVKMNGSLLNDYYYNVYTDRDGAKVEIIVVDYPEEIRGNDYLRGGEPVGELRLGRSELGDISKNDFSDKWFIDEEGNEFTIIDNKLTEVRITYPDNVTDLYSTTSCNQAEAHHTYHYWGDGFFTILHAYDTEVCGYTMAPECSLRYSSEADAFVEILALELPDELLGERVSGQSFYISGDTSGAMREFFDEDGNRIIPFVTDRSEENDLPEGINDMLLEVNIYYSDGQTEKLRIDPLNKLEGVDYDAIEFNYNSVRFENMLEDDHHWLRDENGNAVYQDWESIMSGVVSE